MITPFNLYKLLVGNIFPKCTNCQFYRPGVVSNGYCKIYGEILEARLRPCRSGNGPMNNFALCGLEGKSFKPAVNQ